MYLSTGVSTALQWARFSLSRRYVAQAVYRSAGGTSLRWHVAQAVCRSADGMSLLQLQVSITHLKQKVIPLHWYRAFNYLWVFFWETGMLALMWFYGVLFPAWCNLQHNPILFQPRCLQGPSNVTASCVLQVTLTHWVCCVAGQWQWLAMLTDK